MKIMDLAGVELKKAKAEFVIAEDMANRFQNNNDPAKQKEIEDANAQLNKEKENKRVTQEVFDAAKAEYETCNNFFIELKASDKDDTSNLHSKPSISRYLAFITLIFIVVFVLVISCLFTYHYIMTGSSLDLKSLTPVVTALALGVAPYIVNKISKAFANQT